MYTSTSRPVPPRRFTLLDGMIVVGSVALALAAPRAFHRPGDLQSLFPGIVADFAWDWDYFDQTTLNLLQFAMPILVPISLGVLVMRLRKPRPRGRLLFRRPGMAAGLALALAWLVAAIYSVVNVVLAVDNGFTPKIGPPPSWRDLPEYLEPFTVSGSILGGFGVVVAWLTLALVGRWRAEATWLDRLGRIVGVIWIGMALVMWFCIRGA